MFKTGLLCTIIGWERQINRQNHLITTVVVKSLGLCNHVFTLYLQSLSNTHSSFNSVPFPMGTASSKMFLQLRAHQQLAVQQSVYIQGRKMNVKHAAFSVQRKLVSESLDSNGRRKSVEA